MTFGEFQWVELIYGFFGSFVGLLLALLTDNRIAKREEKSKIKTLLEAIHDELLAAADLIKEANVEDGTFVLISTFVWKSVTCSDFFPTVLHEENEKCSTILQIYSGIDAFMTLQEKRPDLIEERKAVQKSILESIESFDSMMKKKK